MAVAIAEMSKTRERIWEKKMEIEKERIEVEKERWAYERERSRMEFESRMKELELKLQKKRIICFNFVYVFLIKFNKKFNSITLK